MQNSIDSAPAEKAAAISLLERPVTATGETFHEENNTVNTICMTVVAG